MVIAILIIVSLMFVEMWGKNIEEAKNERRKREEEHDY